MRSGLLLTLLPLVAADLQEWLDGLYRGDDYDFKVTYPSGLSLSTDENAEKRGVLDDDEIMSRWTTPRIDMEGLDEEALKKRYIAFCVITYVPIIESSLIGDAIMGFTFVGANLTARSNGTLSWDGDDVSTSSGDPDAEGGEVKNGTIHVWEQTEELNDWLTHDEADGFPMPMWWNIARVWSNSTSKVSDNFKRANIDFKVQNDTGYARCDVSDTGAPIPGKEVGDTTSCTKSAKPKSKDDKDEETKDGKKDDDGGSSQKGDSEEKSGKEEEGTGAKMTTMTWTLVGSLVSTLVYACAF